MLPLKPAPRSARELLNLFCFYRDETGPEGLFDHVDLTGVEPLQVYYAVHGRPPDSLDTAMADREYSIRDIFAAALRSSEFRRKFVQKFLAAFPEKRRLLFVHIPKCAGSNLSAHLIGQFASLNTKIIDEDITSENDFLLAVKHLILEIQVSDFIYVHGHVHLDTYESWDALRFGDSIFSVLRDPVDLVMSQINYVLTRVYSCEEPVRPDTIGWRKEFDITPSDGPRSREQVIDLGHRIVRHPGVMPENIMSRFLGNGASELAVERIVTRNIEVTDVRRYGDWCRERWKISNISHVNESKKYLGIADLPSADVDAIFDITQEDRRLYKRISDRLAATGKSSLVGRELLADNR